MADFPFDPLDPPQLPPEALRVTGCTCGGLRLHTKECAIWDVDRTEALEAIAAAEARMTAHTDALNTALRSWEDEQHG